jgi:uncharacterized lipoprotein YmbA
MKRLMKRDWTGALARKALLPLSVVALVAGCASTPDRYYTLAVPMNAAAPAVPVSATPLYIELAPLALPERLARPQLLVRRQGAQSSAQVDVLEQHRWTSSFENELRDALASGIASRLGAIDVTKGGKPAGQPVWRIAVQVRQFDAVENSRVDADMVWTLKRADGERAVTCSWSASEPVGSSSGIDGLAQAAQRVTARASEAIGRDVGALRMDANSACQR